MATFLEVEFTVTLMRLTEHGYVESGDRPFTYYFAAPDAWAPLPDAALQQRAFDAAERMYADTNSRLRAAEPSDPNYLKVKSTRARVLTADEASSWPWISAEPPVWDPTPCAVVHADGTYAQVNPLELGNAVPIERGSLRLDRVLPLLLTKVLPSCTAVYEKLLPNFNDPRPLDARSRNVWGAAVLFVCALDRLAVGKEYPDPFATVEQMIAWLAESGEMAPEDVESARQIYKKMFEYNVFRPNDTLYEMIYARAWWVRYSEYDPNNPSAFQGFIHCLAGCRDSLHAFDLHDPRPAAAPATRPVVYDKIDAFNTTALLPAFEEIRATLERHGKRVIIAEDERLGDEFLEGFYREIHETRRYARELIETPPSAEEMYEGGATYLGHTLVAVDPAEPGESRYAGKVFETILFTVGFDDEVYAAPFVLYHMKFDNKLHGFKHRFDNAQEFQRVETIDKYAVQNHFLGAYDFFKIHARGDRRPW